MERNGKENIKGRGEIRTENRSNNRGEERLADGENNYRKYVSLSMEGLHGNNAMTENWGHGRG